MQKWVTGRKMGQTYENRSRVEKCVTLEKWVTFEKQWVTRLKMGSTLEMGYTWKNESQTRMGHV